MTENQELIAKALEIAITLTGAKDTWLQKDGNNVIMTEQLLHTVEAVIQTINSSNLINSNSSRVFPIV